ncbi:MAG TPA: hypothetical protein VES79_03715 [Solirubrobacteraceae bacterium]|nr:hypothetical protein [Solirubrobacteraceae bacterium]
MPDPARQAPHLDDALFIACGLAWSAAVIHVAAAVGHSGEHVLHAVFFAVLAAAQLAWGVALYRRPARGLLSAGAAVSLVVAAIWIVSRTSGLPLGPDAWAPEPVGAIDSIASADEAVLALLVGFRLRSRPTGPLLGGVKRLATAAALGLIPLSSLALTVGDHSH